MVPGSREILVQSKSSALVEFEECYDTSKIPRRANGVGGMRHYTDIGLYFNIGNNSYHDSKWPKDENTGKEYFGLFSELFQKARALFVSVFEEIMSASCQ